MSAFHEPGDTEDYRERDDYAALRDDEWLEYLREREMEKFSRLRDHAPIAQKPVRREEAA